MLFRKWAWFVVLVFCLQEKELISLKREAKLKGGFYVDPEAKLLFIIRIRGYVILFGVSIGISKRCYIVSLSFVPWICSINAIDPKTKKILQLLRLRQVCVHFYL